MKIKIMKKNDVFFNENWSMDQKIDLFFIRLKIEIYHPHECISFCETLVIKIILFSA